MKTLNFDDVDVEEHPRRPHLHFLLRERLPELGLDADMYGPYIWGDDDDDDDDKDGDELREIVVGVLQASSETHSESDDVWERLLDEIHDANRRDASLRRAEHERRLRETKARMEEDLARAKMEEQQRDVATEKKKKASSQVDDEQKRILMQRYGYDEPAEDEGDGSGFGGNSAAAAAKKKSAAAAASAAAPTNNRDAAKAAYQEKSRELRGAQKTTKAEERKKTKDQKASKAQMKEARRKRSQKGERKA